MSHTQNFNSKRKKLHGMLISKIKNIFRMNYEVAIVIPTLNEERFISRCLNSIIKQTYEFEKWM